MDTLVVIPPTLTASFISDARCSANAILSAWGRRIEMLTRISGSKVFLRFELETPLLVDLL